MAPWTIRARDRVTSAWSASFGSSDESTQIVERDEIRIERDGFVVTVDDRVPESFGDRAGELRGSRFGRDLRPHSHVVVSAAGLAPPSETHVIEPDATIIGERFEPRQHGLEFNLECLQHRNDLVGRHPDSRERVHRPDARATDRSAPLDPLAFL